MPRGGPMGRGGDPTDKAKDFKGAMKRLFSELKPFKILIFIAIVLAILGSIMSIIAPNKLSDLTDKISEGLVVNKDNMQILAEKVQQNFMTQNMQEIEIDGTKINIEDQTKFMEIMSSMDENSSATDLYSKLDEMPESIKTVVEPKMDMDGVKKIAITLASLYIASALFTFIQSIAMTDVANKFAKSLRSRISHKINKLPLRYYDKHLIGDILSRVTNDIDTIAQSMNQSLATLVSSTVLFLGTIVMMFYTNWIMALTAIGASLIGFIFMFGILGKSQKYFVARQVELGKLNGHIEEVYSGLNVVKAYNGGKLANEKFDVLNKNVYEANRKSQFLSGLMQPLMNFIGNFGYVAVCIVGAILTMRNSKLMYLLQKQ